jgi:hypothetical protein
VKLKIPAPFSIRSCCVDLMTTRFPRGRRRGSTGAGVCLRAWGDLVQTYDQERRASAERARSEHADALGAQRGGGRVHLPCDVLGLRDASRASRPSASLAA